MASNPESPCIGVCVMDRRSALCAGCGRTLAEIERWSLLDRAERFGVMAGLRHRMIEAGLTPLARD